MRLEPGFSQTWNRLSEIYIKLEDFEKRSGPKASSEPESRTPVDRPDFEETSDPPTGNDSTATRSLGPETTRPVGPNEAGSAAIVLRGVGGSPVRWGPLELIEKVGEGAFGETLSCGPTISTRPIGFRVSPTTPTPSAFRPLFSRSPRTRSTTTRDTTATIARSNPATTSTACGRARFSSIRKAGGFSTPTRRCFSGPGRGISRAWGPGSPSDR